MRPNRGRCHLSSRREKENIPILKYITTEERQEDTISKVNEEYMNLISGTLFDCYVVKLCNRTHKKRVSCVLKFFKKA